MTNAFLLFLFWSDWINNIIKTNVTTSTPYPQNLHRKRQKRFKMSKIKILLVLSSEIDRGGPSEHCSMIYVLEKSRANPALLNLLLNFQNDPPFFFL